MSQVEKWPSPFWKHYAQLYPCTPRAGIFQNGWWNYKAWYQVDHLNLAVKQLLRTGGNVVVYVTGEKSENKEQALARLVPFQEQIHEITGGYHPPEAPEPALCANFLALDGGTKDPKNWDEAVKFMEDRLQEYGKVFFPEGQRWRTF